MAIDGATGHSGISTLAANAAVAVPVSIYLLGHWAVTKVARSIPRRQMIVIPLAILLILLMPLTSMAVLWIGFILVLLVIARAITDSPVASNA